MATRSMIRTSSTQQREWDSGQGRVGPGPGEAPQGRPRLATYPTPGAGQAGGRRPCTSAGQDVLDAQATGACHVGQHGGCLRAVAGQGHAMQNFRLALCVGGGAAGSACVGACAGARARARTSASVRSAAAAWQPKSPVCWGCRWWQLAPLAAGGRGVRLGVEAAQDSIGVVPEGCLVGTGKE